MANFCKIIILLSIIVFMAAVSPVQPAAAAGWKTIDAETLHKWLQGEKVTLVNVMSRIECLDHRIPGSLCIACEEFETRLSEIPSEVKLVLYCESEGCIRSGQAGDVAVRKGKGNVYMLKGGMPAWKRAGFVMESPQRVKRTPIKSIKAAELQKWRDGHRDGLILDIRTESAYSAEHLPAAVNIPFYQLHKRYGELLENRPVLIVDDQGFRSFLAGSYLYQKGFHDLNRLFGGMAKWRAANSRKPDR